MAEVPDAPALDLPPVDLPELSELPDLPDAPVDVLPLDLPAAPALELPPVGLPDLPADALPPVELPDLPVDLPDQPVDMLPPVALPDLPVQLPDLFAVGELVPAVTDPVDGIPALLEQQPLDVLPDLGAVLPDLAPVALPSLAPLDTVLPEPARLTPLLGDLLQPLAEPDAIDSLVDTVDRSLSGVPVLGSNPAAPALERVTSGRAIPVAGTGMTTPPGRSPVSRTPLGPTAAPWSLFDGFTGGPPVRGDPFGLAGMQALISSSLGSLPAGAGLLPARAADGLGPLAGSSAAQSAPGSQPAPTPQQPAPPAPAPGGATAAGGSGGIGFSGVLLAAFLALAGLAALRVGRLAIASAHLRPQAYIALLERPG
jgi:hypothetical protein